MHAAHLLDARGVRGARRHQARDPARRPPQAHPQGPCHGRLQRPRGDRRPMTPPVRIRTATAWRLVPRGRFPRLRACVRVPVSPSAPRRTGRRRRNEMTRTGMARRRGWAIGAAIALSVVALAAPGGSAAQSPTPGGNITMAIEGEPDVGRPGLRLRLRLWPRDVRASPSRCSMFCENDTKLCPEPRRVARPSARRPDLHPQDPPGRQVPRRHDDDRR